MSLCLDNDLLTILGEKGLLIKQHKRPPLVRQDSICLSPRKGLPRDPHTGKGILILNNLVGLIVDKYLNNV